MNITMVFTIAYSFHWWALLDCEKVHLVNNFPVDICFPVHVHISFQIWATLSNWMKDDSYSLKTSFKWPYTVSNIILYCYCSVVQSCLTLWDPMDCSMPDFPVHHQLLELAQIHVHWVGDAIQPCHPLLSPSSPLLLLPSILPNIWVFSNDIQYNNYPGGGNGNPLQYSCLENPLDRGLQSMGSESRTRLSNWDTHTHTHDNYQSSRFFLGYCESVEIKHMLQLLSSTETYALPCVKLDSYSIS